VVIATDRKVASVLVDTNEYQKIQNITPTTGNILYRYHITPYFHKILVVGVVYAGMGPDFRVIVRNARKAAQKYYLTYREIQPVSQVVKESALLMQEYTQSGGVRPFGVSCLVAGYDDEGPQLFQVDPSGSSFGWKATAIGTDFSVQQRSLIIIVKCHLNR
jgi:20S proteasome subunit alpha 2